MGKRLETAGIATALAALLALSSSSCSIKRLAVKSLGSALAESGDVFASDEDPELVRDAIPFALKTTEALLAQAPNDPNLLLAACKGFTQYSFAFVQTDAKLAEPTDYARSVALKERAVKLYLRGRDYGMRGLERRYPGIGAQLKVEPVKAAARIEGRDMAFLFWTGAAWGSAISAAKDRPELVADVDVIRALMDRGLALDESYDKGSIHEVMIGLESLPEMMGGSMDRARKHFERAVELSQGKRASPYVSLALDVSVQVQDREEFETLMARALEIDPDADPGNRLATIITQRVARAMLERADDLFIE